MQVVGSEVRPADLSSNLSSVLTHSGFCEMGKITGHGSDPTGLGVVPKADAAALCTGCLPVLPVIRVVSTEASVARLYPGKLP